MMRSYLRVLQMTFSLLPYSVNGVQNAPSPSISTNDPQQQSHTIHITSGNSRKQIHTYLGVLLHSHEKRKEKKKEGMQEFEMKQLGSTEHYMHYFSPSP